MSATAHGAESGKRGLLVAYGPTMTFRSPAAGVALHKDESAHPGWMRAPRDGAVRATPSADRRRPPESRGLRGSCL